ncbi:hypothetical protein [Actinoplanes palleronii]|uniref:Uncharacterized protein n=1 Tax=Actinoplanes palleronii TaxID=113570 RepID=A0ABQ4BKM6_9ACTN|nr:hypothetical protein [Actinoplanes palleronii]GIE71234.1 hypothetical protein Apa02nite_073420 [Actinoplanes palleronii]
MTGNAPQPGETPTDNPWGKTEPDATWWHGPADRDPTSQDWADRAGDAARAAGAQDVTQRLTPPADPAGERLATAGELMIIEPGRLGDEATASTAAAVPGTMTTAAVPEAATTAAAPEGKAGDRPTVVLDPRRPPRAPLPPLPAGATPVTEARLERMENSPFWSTDEARIAAEARNDPRPGRRRRPPAANPVAAMVSLVGLSLVAAFFAWVSAEPFWLATGHGDPGYAITTQCDGAGLTQHCTGRFATADGSFTAGRVTLLGISGGAREPGAVTGARMVRAGSDQAYTAPPGLLMHLRWALGFLLVLICGYGIAGATGARRLESPRSRRYALLASVGGPILLLAGFLAAAY